MSGKKAKHRRGAVAAPGRVATVTVCRGCCCGSPTKHPDIDHDAQLAQLRTGVSATGAQLRIADCLDACEHSNVVVLTPTSAARGHGGRPVWLGEVLDPATIDEVIAWVAAGGPTNTTAPTGLDQHLFSPTRQVRKAGREHTISSRPQPRRR
jgi:hypothetical protein